MARGKKAAGNPPADIPNGYDGPQIAAYVRKIEGHFADMASEQGAYMARCRTIRGSIAVVYTEADALGIPRKVLKSIVDQRKLEAKIRGLADKLDDGDVETRDQIVEALGDFVSLPLGAAAVQRAPKTQEHAQANADALDDLTDDDAEDLRPRFLQDGEPAEPVH